MGLGNNYINICFTYISKHVQVTSRELNKYVVVLRIKGVKCRWSSLNIVQTPSSSTGSASDSWGMDNQWSLRTYWQLSVQVQVTLSGCFSSPTQTCGQPHLDSHVAENGDITSGACRSHITAIKEAEGLLREARRCPSRWARNGQDARSLAVLEKKA